MDSSRCVFFLFLNGFTTFPAVRFDPAPEPVLRFLASAWITDSRQIVEPGKPLPFVLESGVWGRDLPQADGRRFDEIACKQEIARHKLPSTGE